MSYADRAEVPSRATAVLKDASPVEMVRNFAQELADRAEKLAAETDDRVGRVVGYRPQAVNGNKTPTEQPGALTEQMHISLGRIREAMDHISNEVARL